MHIMDSYRFPGRGGEKNRTQKPQRVRSRHPATLADTVMRGKSRVCVSEDCQKDSESHNSHCRCLCLGRIDTENIAITENLFATNFDASADTPTAAL